MTELSVKQSEQYVVFMLDDQRYALHLSVVEKIIPAVEITRLPGAPAVVLGIINVEGQIIPVIDTRKCFSLPERELSLNDVFIKSHTSKNTLALVADSIGGIINISRQVVTAASEILPHLKHFEGVVKLEEGIILVGDLEKFLSLQEEKVLDEAMSFNMEDV